MENKDPHQKMSDKNSGLSSTQEVTLNHEFKEADNIYSKDKSREDEKSERD